MLRRSSNLPASFGTALFPWAHRADARRLLGRGQPDSLPIWSCSVWGLPCGSDYSGPGALLPHLFTLTGSCEPAVYSLLHWPSGCLHKHPSRTLSGTLPCGVRTFLPRQTLSRTKPAAIVRPPALISLARAAVRRVPYRSLPYPLPLFVAQNIHSTAFRSVP